MNAGTQVECVACDGAHKGRVVHVIVPNVLYGVAWAAANPNRGKPGNTDPQYPQEFVKAHSRDITTTRAASIRPA